MPYLIIKFRKSVGGGGGGGGGDYLLCYVVFSYDFFRIGKTVGYELKLFRILTVGYEYLFHILFAS